MQEATLHRLAAESEIRALIARYSDAVFRHDPVAYGACFAVDGTWNAFGQIHKGREAITAFWIEVMKQFPFAWQIVSNIVLEIAETTALGRGFVNETLQLQDGTPRAVLGIYHDEFVLKDGAWLFSCRRYDQVYIGPASFAVPVFERLPYGPPPHDFDPTRLTAPLRMG